MCKRGRYKGGKRINRIPFLLQLQGETLVVNSFLVYSIGYTSTFKYIHIYKNIFINSKLNLFWEMLTCLFL